MTSEFKSGEGKKGEIKPLFAGQNTGRSLFAKYIEKKHAPLPDIAICSECGWRGPVDECPKEEDGDWEYGYYTIDVCPKCEDGGCIDDYDMTPERLKEWEEWHDK